ncbi:MAG: hypothetical protein L6R41_006074 [Letrouitia leprolyta]|nr:MAG: hypothetical protein L6R41_006074 [Letrouitia leprolyta]
MPSYTQVQTDVIAPKYLQSLQSVLKSAVELDSGRVGWTDKLDNPTLIWLTSFPHTINSLQSTGNPLVLVSRSFSGLRNAQQKLRHPGKNLEFDRKYGIALHCARSRIIIQNQQRLQPKGKKWSLTKPNSAAMKGVMTRSEARKLDDESDQTIADAFAVHLSSSGLPPCLADDLSFNAIYKPHDPRFYNPSVTSSSSTILSASTSGEHAQFPVVFRAQVPSDWRGLSQNRADEHQVHVLELTESVREDLTRFWFKTWDPKNWPEDDSISGGPLKRTKSWNSIFEVDHDDHRRQQNKFKRTNTASTVESRVKKGEGICLGKLVCGAYRKVGRGILRVVHWRKIKKWNSKRFPLD